MVTNLGKGRETLPVVSLEEAWSVHSCFGRVFVASGHGCWCVCRDHARSVVQDMAAVKAEEGRQTREQNGNRVRKCGQHSLVAHDGPPEVPESASWA